MRKVVGGFGKKSCVSTGVRKPGNTYASPTGGCEFNPRLRRLFFPAVKVALNPNTTNQPEPGMQTSHTNDDETDYDNTVDDDDGK